MADCWSSTTIPSSLFPQAHADQQSLQAPPSLTAGSAHMTKFSPMEVEMTCATSDHLTRAFSSVLRTEKTQNMWQQAGYDHAGNSLTIKGTCEYGLFCWPALLPLGLLSEEKLDAYILWTKNISVSWLLQLSLPLINRAPREKLSWIQT